MRYPKTPGYRATALALGLIAAPLAYAQSDTPARTDEALIERIAGESVIIENRFDGPGDMTGYLIRDAGDERPVVAWVTDDPRQLVIGNVFDAWGRNLTNVAAEANESDNPITQLMSATVEETWARAMRQIEAAETTNAQRTDNGADDATGSEQATPITPERAPEALSAPAPSATTDESGAAESTAPSADTDLTRNERINQAVRENNGVINDPAIVTEAVGGVRALREYGSVVTLQDAGGPRAARVGIYFDPACAYCKRLAEELDPERLGNARVDWIPVGFQQSREAAQRMLVDDPDGAAKRAIDDGPAALGGDEPPSITEAAIEGVSANEQVMRNTLIGATPTVVVEYPDPDSEAISASVYVGLSAEQLMTMLTNNAE